MPTHVADMTIYNVIRSLSALPLMLVKESSMKKVFPDVSMTTFLSHRVDEYHFLAWYRSSSEIHQENESLNLVMCSICAGIKHSDWIIFSILSLRQKSHGIELSHNRNWTSNLQDFKNKQPPLRLFDYCEDKDVGSWVEALFCGLLPAGLGVYLFLTVG